MSEILFPWWKDNILVRNCVIKNRHQLLILNFLLDILCLDSHQCYYELIQFSQLLNEKEKKIEFFIET